MEELHEHRAPDLGERRRHPPLHAVRPVRGDAARRDEHVPRLDGRAGELPLHGRAQRAEVRDALLGAVAFVLRPDVIVAAMGRSAGVRRTPADSGVRQRFMLQGSRY